jgi:hypothetical protein
MTATKVFSMKEEASNTAHYISTKEREMNKEYYEAKANLCKNLAIKQMTEGDSKEAGANLMRMVRALTELELINYKDREGKDNEANQLL